jgi:hypothetical protein
MTEIISEEVLVDELNHFRDILNHYDYEEVSNVIFFDIDSLNYYMQTHKDNPFERQYKEIETAFDLLSPYLPSSITEETIQMILEIMNRQDVESELVKENLLFNLKLEFIERVKGIQSEDEWNLLIAICKKLRNEKLFEVSQER